MKRLFRNHTERKLMTQKNYFLQALPVWEKDKDQEMNYFLRFETMMVQSTGILRIAACNVYRVFVNGNFVGMGPARAAHGFYRVDEIDLGEHLKEENNYVVIEVGAYRVNSFSDLDMPGFLQCEIISDGEIAAATGVEGFSVSRMTEKLQKVQRYSFQRTFCEEYCLPAKVKQENVDLEILPQKKLLDRGVAYCNYEKKKFPQSLPMDV